MTEPIINGDSIQLAYGDEVITLPQKLQRHELQIQRLERLMILLAIILAFHTLVPAEMILPFLLGFFGL